MPDPHFQLTLYVSGGSATGRMARVNLRRLCAGVAGTCRTRVVDVRENFAEAEAARVLATPLLVLEAPGPPRRVVGDLSNLPAVMEFLGLPRAEADMDADMDADTAADTAADPSQPDLNPNPR